MLRKCLVGGLVLAIAGFAFAPAAVTAQGKAKGLGKALSKAGANGSASSALNRAGQNASQVGGSLNRANGLGRAGALGGKGTSSKGLRGKPPGAGAQGLARRADGSGGTNSMAGADEATRHQRQLLIEQTNRDRRIAQAQHLREIAARNGDAELAANADRLETLANDHYQARVEHLARFGVADPNLPSDPGAGDPPAPTPAPETEPVSEPMIQPVP